MAQQRVMFFLRHFFHHSLVPRSDDAKEPICQLEQDLRHNDGQQDPRQLTDNGFNIQANLRSTRQGCSL